MLPLLPAIILLLLQGPSSLERLAHEGALPPALDAIHRLQIIESEVGRSEAEAIASLIALSGNPELSQALWQLLSAVADEPTTDVQLPIDESEPPCVVRDASARTEDGFFSCRRSRDGPHLIA